MFLGWEYLSLLIPLSSPPIPKTKEADNCYGRQLLQQRRENDETLKSETPNMSYYRTYLIEIKHEEEIIGSVSVVEMIQMKMRSLVEG